MDLSWLLPDGKGIPVLMYHKVWPGTSDGLTITPENLRAQWTMLKQEGYHTLSLPEYLEIATGRRPQPARALMLTFDDGYLNNLQFVYPLLQELGWQATFFIIGHVLESGSNETGPDEKMTVAQLATLDPAVVQLALHGYHHKHLGRVSLPEMRNELQQALRAFSASRLPFHRVWAYAYGGRPTHTATLAALREMMKELDISAAFRIGNRVGEVPAPDIYEINRIDVKGTDTLRTLRIKLKKGRLKPF